MSAEVIVFPARAVEVEPANDDGCGPPVGTEAWRCTYCQDDGGDAAGFAFYITPVYVRCWTCHNPQDFG